MRHLFLFYALIIVCPFGIAQKEISNFLSFKFVYGSEIVSLNEEKINSDQQTKPTIQVLKFYISSIEFLDNKKTVWKESSDYHLVDASQPESLKIKLSKPNGFRFTEVKFNLGVDSVTNVSGVRGGDLDPTKGMYWTWQSGYINFKIEGRSNACKNPKKEFQFHLGGYKAPYSTIKIILIETSTLELVFDVKHLMNQLDLSQQDHLMLPGCEAARLSEIVSQSFHR